MINVGDRVILLIDGLPFVSDEVTAVTKTTIKARDHSFTHKGAPVGKMNPYSGWVQATEENLHKLDCINAAKDNLNHNGFRNLSNDVIVKIGEVILNG